MAAPIFGAMPRPRLSFAAGNRGRHGRVERTGRDGAVGVPAGGDRMGRARLPSPHARVRPLGQRRVTGCGGTGGRAGAEVARLAQSHPRCQAHLAGTRDRHADAVWGEPDVQRHRATPGVRGRTRGVGAIPRHPDECRHGSRDPGTRTSRATHSRPRSPTSSRTCRSTASTTAARSMPTCAPPASPLRPSTSSTPPAPDCWTEDTIDRPVDQSIDHRLTRSPDRSRHHQIRRSSDSPIYPNSLPLVSGPSHNRINTAMPAPPMHRSIADRRSRPPSCIAPIR